MPHDRWVRMDVDTQWAYHRKVRELQRLYPEEWPGYMVAFFALLGEAWAARSREVRLVDSWCPALQIAPDDANRALMTVSLLDRWGRVPKESWADWYGPAARRSQSARNAAASRWNATALPIPNQTKPNRTKRARVARARERV